MNNHPRIRVFATTRQVTGPACRDNRVLRSCTHHHRSAQTARACADKMLRAVLKNNPMSPSGGTP